MLSDVAVNATRSKLCPSFTQVVLLFVCAMKIIKADEPRIAFSHIDACFSGDAIKLKKILPSHRGTEGEPMALLANPS